MSHMFHGAQFSGELSRWNMGNVRSVANMFAHSQFNGSISGWGLSRAVDLNALFAYCPFNGDISEWDVSNIRSMVGTFQGSSFNGDISQWDVSGVETFARMFKDSHFNGDISQWQFRCADNMLEMFEGSSFNGDISKWSIPLVKETRQMFHRAAFAGDMSNVHLRTFCSLARMFDGDFQGVLPTSGVVQDRHKLYGAMLGGEAPLRQYLKSIPFNTVHADVLIGSNKKPGWLNEKDYVEAKKQYDLARTLGVTDNEARQFMVQHYHRKKEGGVSLPNLDITMP